MIPGWHDANAYFLALALRRIVEGPEPDVAAADEFLIEPDAEEAERFRLEQAREARGEGL